MKTLTLTKGGLETLPVLVESTTATIYFTSSDSVAIYVGNSQTDMQLYKTFAKNEAFGISFSDSFNSEWITVRDLAIGSFMKITSATALTSATLQWRGEEALLITPMEVSLLARPCYADEQKVMRYIAEAEQNNIKPILGDDLFLRLKTGDDKLLLNGGTYERDGRRHQLNGVKRALAYYVYSRLLEFSSVDITRQGVVNRRSEFSDGADSRDIVSVSRETYAIANRYMDECMEYVGGSCKTDKVETNRIKVRIIGD